jgi:hypothetical protein
VFDGMLNRNATLVAFTVAVTTILIVSSILPASAQLSQWRSLNPTRNGVPVPPPPPYLFSVQMLGPNYGWAVGGDCDIYATLPVGVCNGFALFWDGARWRNVLVPVLAGTLASVFIVSQNDVWAVGTRNVIGPGGIATVLHWDGVSWVQLPPPPASVLDLFGVFMMPGGTDGWLVGTAAAVPGATNVLRWSGMWPTGALTPLPLPLAAPGDAFPDVLRSVYLLSSTHGWIVGSATVGAPVDPRIFRWDGAGWLNVQAPPLLGDLLSVYSVSLTDAWAVGETNTIIRWNGASWTGPMVAPTVGLGVNYYSIRMVSATDGWIAGIVNPTSNEGLLLRWDGTAWSIIRSYVIANLYSIFLLPGGAEGAAVGDAETIIHWSGSTWFARTSPTALNLNAISMVTTNDGWAVGDFGNIFRYDGRSWSHYETLPSGQALMGLHMRTSTDGWAVGDFPAALFPPTILHWSGAAWTVVSPSGVALSEALNAVDAVSATEAWAVGTGNTGPATMLKWDGSIWTSVPSGTVPGAVLNSIDMLSSSDGWAVGCAAAPCTNLNAIIVRWNGLAWAPVTPPPAIGGLNDIFMLSPTDGWAVGTTAFDGQATIIHWDGVQWRRVPAPPTGAFGPGVGLNSLHMLSPADGWAVGLNVIPPPPGLSLILHWDGTTWDVVATAPVPPNMVPILRSVFMITSLDGWIVSDQGLILHYGPESVPGTTTSTSTIIQTTTSTTITTATSSTFTTPTSTTAPSTWGVPGYPIESILAGLVAGVAVLAVLRHRPRRRS